MARYRVDEAHFLDNKYIEAGSIVDWEGPPSRHMTPVEQVSQERKARYDEGRPHIRPSRDILPRAAIVRDVMQRQPGQPRAAGPPGQAPAPSADPASPEKTLAIVEERRKADEQDEALLEEALKQPEPAPAPEPAAQPERRTKPKPKK